MSRQRHVVVLNWKDSTHPAAGGAEVYCEAIARELVDLDLRVTLVTSRPTGTAARDEVDGYRVRRMGGTYTVYLFALLWLLRHRRRIDAVVDSQNGIPFFSPLVLRSATSIVLLIHHVHQDQFGMYFSPFMARVGRWLESSASRRVYRDRAVAAVSPSSRTEIRRRLKLAGPIHVVPNGSPAVVEASSTRADVPTIACVGRLVPHKRWDLLLELAHELRATVPDLKVDLIGTGSELEPLVARVAELGLENTVMMHGWVSGAERDRLLGRAWLTVSTSVGEGWGLSIIEACTVGVPAVSLDVPGLRDSVRNGVTGWLVTEGDDLADAVRTALAQLADPVQAAAYARRCRDWAASLQWSASAERFHAIFADEAIRLGIPFKERAREVDVATVVTLEVDGANSFDLSVLRPSDQTTFCKACLADHDGPFRILLGGRDEADALELLALGGIDTRRHPMQLRLCRPHQLLTWPAGGIGHSYYSLDDGPRCPRRAAPVGLPADLRSAVHSPPGARRASAT